MNALLYFLMFKKTKNKANQANGSNNSSLPFIPVHDQLSSSPPRPSFFPPPLFDGAPAPRCAASLPARAGAARAPAASSSHARDVVAAEK